MDDYIFMLTCGGDFWNKKDAYAKTLLDDGYKVNTDFYGLIICDPNGKRSLNSPFYFDSKLEVIFEKIYEKDATNECIKEVTYLERCPKEGDSPRQRLEKYLDGITVKIEPQTGEYDKGVKEGWNSLIEHLKGHIKTIGMV